MKFLNVLLLIVTVFTSTTYAQTYLTTPLSRAQRNGVALDAISSSVDVHSNDFICRSSEPSPSLLNITVGASVNLRWQMDAETTAGTCRVYLSDKTTESLKEQHFFVLETIDNCHEKTGFNLTIPTNTPSCTECVLRWEFVTSSTYFSNCVDVSLTNPDTTGTVDLDHLELVTVPEMLLINPPYYGIDNNNDDKTSLDGNNNAIDDDESLGASAGIIAGLLGISCLLGMLFAFAWSRIFGMNMRHDDDSVSHVEAYPSGVPKISRRPEIPQEDRFDAVVSIDIDNRLSPFVPSQGA